EAFNRLPRESHAAVHTAFLIPILEGEVDLRIPMSGDRHPEVTWNGEDAHLVVHRIDGNDDHALRQRCGLLLLLVVVAAEKEKVQAPRAVEARQYHSRLVSRPRDCPAGYPVQPGLDLIGANSRVPTEGNQND